MSFVKFIRDEFKHDQIDEKLKEINKNLDDGLSLEIWVYGSRHLELSAFKYSEGECYVESMSININKNQDEIINTIERNYKEMVKKVKLKGV